VIISVITHVLSAVFYSASVSPLRTPLHEEYQKIITCTGAVGKYLILRTPLHEVYQNVITFTGAVGKYLQLCTPLHEVYQNIITCTGAVGKYLLLSTPLHELYQNVITCTGWQVIKIIHLYIKNIQPLLGRLC
jgi:hypothetical protein